MKPSLFPSPSFRWPDHSPYCPGRPGYKGVCDCGAEAPRKPSLPGKTPFSCLRHRYEDYEPCPQCIADITTRLRAERDELVVALEAVLDLVPSQDLTEPDLEEVREARALLARIKGNG